ncbi:glycosyltransferase family 4 protein [Fictibacillus terranigra]|uniref:Glycosyltransferase family 4 protein n=1 Tax=Fictibacillus terranigra TaxID=3058424 RepID=A0ABT8E257_9BACL|nr:glycosyltransferase family 4 protein [Fictibacillus sp. CENA-BCM004]MDN4072005.1 glycosyltransferase family 4 protein [Fictibacillus sp. CENA-BCM004]
MKVWILNHVALKPSETGITRHYDIAHELVKKDHKIRIFASSFLAYRFVWRNKQKKNYKENVNGVIFEWLWTLPYKGNGVMRILNMISYFFMALWRGMMKKERPDAIVGSSVHLFACLAAYFLSKWKKAAYIVEIRDLWPRTLIELGSMSKYHPAVLMFGAIEKFVYKRADRIIVTLPGAAQYIKEMGVDEKIIHVIPNGISMDRMEEKEGKSSLEDQINEIKERHGQVAMYVGSHGVANSLETVVNSAKFVSPEKTAYVLVGDGPEKDNLKKLAEDYEHVYFFDGIPKKEVMPTLALADVLLVSMLDTQLYKYGISLNKLNDYLLIGKPILFAGNVSNDIVAEAKAGKSVSPEKPGEFADGLEELLSLSEDEKEQIARNSYRYVNEKHNITKLADRFLDICAIQERDEKSRAYQLSMKEN